MSDLETPSKKVRNVIEEIIRKSLVGVVFDRIVVTPEHDEFGERVLIIRAVYDGDFRRLDAGKMASLVPLMRPKLEKRGETAFPLIVLIDKTELEGQDDELERLY